MGSHLRRNDEEAWHRLRVDPCHDVRTSPTEIRGRGPDRRYGLRPRPPRRDRHSTSAGESALETPSSSPRRRGFIHADVRDRAKPAASMGSRLRGNGERPWHRLKVDPFHDARTSSTGSAGVLAFRRVRPATCCRRSRMRPAGGATPRPTTWASPASAHNAGTSPTESVASSHSAAFAPIHTPEHEIRGTP